ncbi:MAG: hypothetical protein M3R27_14710 [Bacteroidota bacterium]|nr:hypothetical protein [Bacteroidota bacterium]
MKLHRLLLTAIIALFCSFTVNAQTERIPLEIKKTYYYSFEGVNSESQIENLKRKVSSLKGVTEVKSEFKADKGKGQIIVVVIEKQQTNEGDILFNIVDLKEAIIQSQLSPFELTQEETPVQN